MNSVKARATRSTPAQNLIRKWYPNLIPGLDAVWTAFDTYKVPDGQGGFILSEDRRRYLLNIVQKYLHGVPLGIISGLIHDNQFANGQLHQLDLALIGLERNLLGRDPVAYSDMLKNETERLARGVTEEIKNRLPAKSLSAAAQKGYKDGYQAGRIKALDSAPAFLTTIQKLFDNLNRTANSLSDFDGAEAPTLAAINTEGKKQNDALWIIINALKKFYPGIEETTFSRGLDNRAKTAGSMYTCLTQAEGAAYLMMTAKERSKGLYAITEANQQLMGALRYAEKFVYFDRLSQGKRKPRSKPVDLDGIADKLDDAVTAILARFLNGMTHVQYTLTIGDILFSIVMPPVVKSSDEPLFKKHIWPRVVQAVRQAGFNAAIFKRYEVQGSGDGRLYFTIPAVDRAIDENGIKSYAAAAATKGRGSTLAEDLEEGKQIWVSPSKDISKQLHRQGFITVYHGTDSKTAEKISRWQDLKDGTDLALSPGTSDPSGNAGARTYAENRQWERLGQKRGGSVLKFDIPLDHVGYLPTTYGFYIIK